MKKKVLITGAGGYIGSISSYLFLQHGYEVVAVDSFIRGFRQPLEHLQKTYGQEQFRFYEHDLCKNSDEIFSKEQGINCVIHYAALCNIGESETEPGAYFSNNTQSTIGLLEAMRKAGVSNIVASATCAVYGEPQQEFISEDHPLDPRSHPYSESKYMSERIMQWFSKTYGINYVFLRYFNVCGATDDGIIGDSKKPSYHLMQNAIRGILGIEDFYFTYTPAQTPDGSPIRDYVNVLDLNQAHINAVEYLLGGGRSDIFNLGTGTGNSVLSIIKTVETILEKKVDVNNGKRRAGDVSRAVASNEKISRILNWKPTHSIEDSVHSLVKWYTTHPKGWDY